MKTTYKKILSSSTLLISTLIFPVFAFASTSAGGPLGAELEVSNILQSIINFITSENALFVVIIGIVLGGGLIIFARQNDSKGWHRVGQAVIGGTVIFGAIGVANLFFSGAVI